MNFARGHNWLPLVNILIIVVCAVLLYREHASDTYANREPALGRVIFQMGRTQNKARAQVIFQDLARNGSVHAGDTVRTARAAEVMLQLVGGTQIALEEFSMVVINRPEKKLRLKYSYGTMRLKKSRGQEVDVVTKSGSVLVDRGDVSISGGKSGKTRVLVNSGSVRVSAGGNTTTVRAGNKAVLDSDGAHTQPLVLAEHAPRDGRRILDKGPKRPVDFRWKFARPASDDKNGRTRFELSARRDFRGIVLKRETSATKLRVDLTPGVYYWRVTRGAEISEPRRLFIIRIPELKTTHPMNGSVFEYLIKPPAVNFTWRPHAFAAKYRLEIAADPGFRSPLRSVETSSRSLVLDLEQGVYYWRLKSSGNVPGASLTGAPIRFTVRKTPLPVLAPGRVLETTTESIREKGLAFRWKAPRSAGEYHLSIARDKGFRDVVVRRSTGKTALNIKRDFDPGRYYWRLRLTHGKNTASSLTREINIRRPLAPPEIVFPGPGAVVDMSNRDYLPLRWRRVPGVKRYRLVLRQVRTGRLVFSRTVAGEAFLFKDLLKLDTGKFTWSVASVDANNRVGKARAVTFTITLRTSPRAPEIQLP